MGWFNESLVIIAVRALVASGSGIASPMDEGTRVTTADRTTSIAPDDPYVEEWDEPQFQFSDTREGEAEVVGDWIASFGDDDEFMDVALVAPRLHTTPPPLEDSALEEHFALPSGCVLSGSSSGLMCGGELVSVVASVTDSAGQDVPALVSVDASGTTVTVESAGQAKFPVAVSMVYSTAVRLDVAEAVSDGFADAFAHDPVFGMKSPGFDEPGLDPSDPTYSPWLHAFTGSGPRYISIPAGYRYCPVWCRPPERHDYCTKSPDYFPYARVWPAWSSYARVAPLRGPCARHDMAIANIAARVLPLSEKRRLRGQVDRAFYGHLRHNCGVAFPGWYYADGRSACFAMAEAYYFMVQPFTTWWNGR